MLVAQGAIGALDQTMAGQKDDTGYGNADDNGLAIAFIMTGSTSINTEVIMYLPLSLTSQEEEKFYIPQDDTQTLKLMTSNHVASTDLTETCIGTTGTTAADILTDTDYTVNWQASTGSALGYIKVKKNADMAYANSHHFGVVSTSNDDTSTKKTSFPTLMTNAASTYELWIEVTKTGADPFTQHLMGAKQLTITARDLEIKTDITATTVSGILTKAKTCTSDFVGQLYDVLLVSGGSKTEKTDYYMDIAFSNGTGANNVVSYFDSGLTEGDVYPSTTGKEVKIYVADSKTILRYALETSTTIASEVAIANFVIPIGTDGASAGAEAAFSPIVTVYKLPSNDPRTKQIVYEKQASLTATDDATPVAVANKITAVSGQPALKNDSVVEIKFKGTSVKVGPIQVVLPVGTVIGSGITFTSSTCTFTQALYYSSPSRKFAYPTAYSTFSGGSATLAHADGGEVTVTGLTTRVSAFSSAPSNPIVT